VGDLAEQVQGVGRESALNRRGLDGVVRQALRLVEPAEQQGGAPERVIDPGAVRDAPARRDGHE
jgi:hypothetical protein